MPQFLFEKPRGRRLLVALQGIAADEFSQLVRQVGIRRPNRSHFVQPDVKPAFGKLPRRFGTGETSADDGDVGSQAIRHP